MLKKILLVLVGSVGAVLLAAVLFINLGPVSNSAVLFNAIFGSGIDTPEQQTLDQRLKLPSGFSLGVYAQQLPRIRFLQFTPSGDLLVTQPRDGKVLLLERDRNQDGVADGVKTLLSGLRRPHSVALRQQWLYVAESNAVGRIGFDSETGELRGEYQQIITGLSDNGNHWTKTIGFGPDGMMYLSMGSTCNVCEEDDSRRATIMRFTPEGDNGEIYATGLRNSVGMDWAPWDNSLYASDNGRDLLGDDYPPCELNRIVKGGFYGWPYINGFGDLDPDFGKGKQSLLATAKNPAHGFRAHNAPLGIRFLATKSWPQQYNNTALVALHGSWNRSEPDGYKVVSLHYQQAATGQGDGEFIEKDFLSGFEKDGKVIGRPVDIAQGPDDCVYISDDYAGAIYRVCYQATALVTAINSASRKPQASGLETFSRKELQQMREQGAHLFRTGGCGECHSLMPDSGDDGKKVLQGLGQRYSLNSLLEFFATPTPPMPPLELSRDQQQALAAYLLSQSGAE